MHKCYKYRLYPNKEQQKFIDCQLGACKGCGSVHDRDVNASINIKNLGLRKPVEPVEKRTVVRSKKQELSHGQKRKSKTK